MTSTASGPANPPTATEQVPDISVVVCTHNGARTLPVALRALTGQQLEGATYELVVVTDHCTDDSAEVAASAGARVVDVVGPGGLAAARNAGVAGSRSGLVAFTDDDCEPEPKWLGELLEPFADASVDGVAGLTVPASHEGLVFSFIAARNPLAPLPGVLLDSRQPLFRLVNYLRTGQGPTPPIADGAPLYSVTGANMAFRRSLLQRVGGFDPRISFGGEEEDLCRRAHRLDGGARFCYRAAARVRHHYRPGLADALRRSRAYGAGNARSALTDPDVMPIVYPFPLLWGAAVVRAVRRGPVAVAVAGAVMPLALYLRWPAYAARERSWRALVFSHLQMAQEAATMVGEVQQAWRMRKAGPR